MPEKTTKELFSESVETAPKPRYPVYSLRNALGRSTAYFNLGFWRDHPADADEASEALALLLAETASLGPQDVVLDVGFGFADQDILWCNRFGPKRIFGVNLCPYQVWQARRRTKELGLSDNIVLFQGSATRLPFAGGAFDAVTALECAFHFRAREDFFREAFRVLKPGGRLALTDVVAFPTETNLQVRLARLAVSHVWDYPKENLYSRSVYGEKLYGAGFRLVEVRSVFGHVIPPILEYARRRLKEKDLTARMDRALNVKLNACLWLQRRFKIRSPFDYIVARALK